MHHYGSRSDRIGVCHDVVGIQALAQVHKEGEQVTRDAKQVEKRGGQFASRYGVTAHRG